MSKFIDPEDNSSNQQNPNKGIEGTNEQYSKNQGNRGKQLNPNQKEILTKGFPTSFGPESTDTSAVREFKALRMLSIDPNLAFELYPELRDEYIEDEFQDVYL